MFYCIFSIKVYCIHFIRHTECFLFQMKEIKISNTNSYILLMDSLVLLTAMNDA